MGNPIRNQNRQTNRPTDLPQHGASTSGATRTARPGGVPAAQNETTQTFHHLQQGSWTSWLQGGERKRKRDTETVGSNPEVRSTRRPSTGAAGTDPAMRPGTGQIPSGYGHQGPRRLLLATGATQLTSSFTSDNGRPATGAAGTDPAMRPGTGQIPSGYGHQGPRRLLLATGATQMTSSFTSDNGRQGRVRGGNWSATATSSSGGLIDLTSEDPVDPGATHDFLRTFPSRQYLKTRLPELGGIDPFEHSTASDFEKALDSELGEKELARLKQRFAPAVIQSGLRQLMAQEIQAQIASAQLVADDVISGKETPVQHAGADAAFQKEVKVQTPVANDRVSGNTVTHTSPTLDDPAKRLALTGRDGFASMAKIWNYDVYALCDSYAQRINRILDQIKSKDRCTWQLLSSARDDHKKFTLNETLLRQFTQEGHFPKFPEFFQQRISISLFYEQLFQMECSVRLLNNALRSLRADMTHTVVEIWLKKFANTIGREVANEFHLSIVLSEIGDDDYLRRPRFERIFILSFRTLLETRNFFKANNEFLSSAIACWPELPGRENHDCWEWLQRPDDVELVKNAQRHIANAREQATRSSNAQHGAFGKKAPLEVQRYVENVLYYFYLSASDFRESRRGPMDWLEMDTGFIVRTHTPAAQIYQDFIDLLALTGLYGQKL